jgi:hypothetical protein
MSLKIFVGSNGAKKKDKLKKELNIKNKTVKPKNK